MMRILLRLFLPIFILTSSAWAGEKSLTPDGYDRYIESYVRTDTGGNIWVAYYDLEGRIHIQNVTQGRDLIANEDRDAVAAGLGFDVQGDHAFVVWREKVGRKRLYFRATHDGGKTLSEPILLDDHSTEALTRFKIGSNSRGDVHIIWHGEKQVSGSRWNIYSISSNDYGRSFSGIKNLTKGNKQSTIPTLLVDEDAAYFFFSSAREGRSYMVFRKTTDRGSTWSAPLEIKETGRVSLFVETVKVGNRLHIFWYNHYKGVQIIEGAYSDDGGKTWVATAIEDSRGLDIGLLRVAHDSKKHIYLGIFYKKSKKGKYNVYIISSEDNGTSWGKQFTVRHYPFNHTRAQDPAILATDGGEVVVVWTDYRNIRRNLYMQYSKDHGKTWQKTDIPLEEPGRFNTHHYPYTDSLVKVKDRYYVLAYRFEGDITLREADLLLLDFKLNNRGAR